MNRSKLFEWLLDNDCPFKWEVAEEDEYFSVDDYSPEEGVKLRFYTDEEDND